MDLKVFNLGLVLTARIRVSKAFADWVSKQTVVLIDLHLHFGKWLYPEGFAVFGIGDLTCVEIHPDGIAGFQVKLLQRVIFKDRKRSIDGISLINSPKGLCQYGLNTQGSETVNRLLS